VYCLYTPDLCALPAARDAGKYVPRRGGSMVAHLTN
jgi:hypothetical protein